MSRAYIGVEVEGKSREGLGEKKVDCCLGQNHASAENQSHKYMWP